jgi:hypothetical protein
MLDSKNGRYLVILARGFLFIGSLLVMIATVAILQFKYGETVVISGQPARSVRQIAEGFSPFFIIGSLLIVAALIMLRFFKRHRGD